MDCRAIRQRLVGYGVGCLAVAEHAEVVRHLEGCADCRAAAVLETELDAALDRLPRHQAPAELKGRLAALMASSSPAAERPAETATPDVRVALPTAGSARGVVWKTSFVSACAAAALVLVVARTTTPRRTIPAITDSAAATELVTEAVNDHLRVVGSSHPVEIESGGIHQVKPWFTGRLEFAPRVAFSGDDDFPLVGGSVGYFRDRKAALFVFRRRLHTITLLVFPPEGLTWPAESLTRLGRLSVSEASARGFSVLLWRDRELGYALVSDVNSRDLEMLASRINPQ